MIVFLAQDASAACLASMPAALNGSAQHDSVAHSTEHSVAWTEVQTLNDLLLNAQMTQEFRHIFS